MKRSLQKLLIFSLLCCTAVAQKAPKEKPTKDPKVRNVAIVVDERLSLLLREPSLYAIPIQRMRRGRQVVVLRSKQADGITFFEVKFSTTSKETGWVQSEALIASFRRNDDQRLAQLVQASEGFAKIERTILFLAYFPKSQLRPSMLLLLGDLVEEEALELSKKAAAKLKRREMAASGAPLHSFFLNYSGLDRFRRLGIRFLFNINTRSFHYDGRAWFEILEKYSKSPEADEAANRLDFLKEKMDRK